MPKTQEYRIILKDIAGYELADRTALNLREAKEKAKHLASDQYAAAAETTHTALGSDRVEIIDECGDIVWDKAIR